MFSLTIKRSVATLGVVAGLLAAAVPAGAVGVGVRENGSQGAVQATSQGIIMKDGNVCDPIRHMGC